jgi:4-hydroxybenzoate polyprenyltransferase
LIAFLKLIRIQNLLIIAFTQYMVRWCLILPLTGKDMTLGEFHFFLLSLSTVLIAAAGYIINDYFDVKIDKVNKPERMVIDKGVKRRVAIGAHTVINILAIVIALYLSLYYHDWKLVVIYAIAETGLWLYSTNFKRQFLSGNLVIAFFTALVPFIAAYNELAWHIEYRALVFPFVAGISFFAFITTLLREIIKDIEDQDGDKEYGCKTMPIVLGVKTCKRIVIALCIATMISLAFIQCYMLMLNAPMSFYYFLIALQLPLAFLIWKTARAQSKSDFRIAGNTAKLIMLLGICYLFMHAY